VLDSGDTGGQSLQACTALTEGCRASAVRREVVLADHGRTCWCRRSKHTAYNIKHTNFNFFYLVLIYITSLVYFFFVVIPLLFIYFYSELLATDHIDYICLRYALFICRHLSWPQVTICSSRIPAKITRVMRTTWHTSLNFLVQYRDPLLLWANTQRSSSPSAVSCMMILPCIQMMVVKLFSCSTQCVSYHSFSALTEGHLACEISRSFLGEFWGALANLCKLNGHCNGSSCLCIHVCQVFGVINCKTISLLIIMFDLF